MDIVKAAEYVGLSKKSFERYEAEGKILTQRYEAPESKERMLDKRVYDRLELDRFVERYLR